MSKRSNRVMFVPVVTAMVLAMALISASCGTTRTVSPQNGVSFPVNTHGVTGAFVLVYDEALTDDEVDLYQDTVAHYREAYMVTVIRRRFPDALSEQAQTTQSWETVSDPERIYTMHPREIIPDIDDVVARLEAAAAERTITIGEIRLLFFTKIHSDINNAPVSFVFSTTVER
jgi:hypothetical protein